MNFAVIRQLFGLLRNYRTLAAIFFVALFLDLIFVSLAPLSFQYIIDRAIIPKSMEQFALILTVLGITGVICLSAGVASDFVLARLSALVQKDMRTRLFKHMQHTNIGYFQKTRPGELLSYYSVDLPSIEGAMTAILTTGIQSLAVVVISTAVLFYLQWSMALLILVGAAVIFIGPYLLGRRAQAVNTAHKALLDVMTGDIQENIKAQKVIKGFNLQQAMIDKFVTRLQSLFVAHYRSNKIGYLLSRVPMVSLLVINLSIIGLGSYLALQDYITLGTLVAFFTMYTSMGNSVFNLTFTLPALTNASVSMERIRKLLDEPREASGGAPAEKLQMTRPEITFANVTFKYTEERDALHKINLHIPPGATAAFVGASGSGKSTLVQLALGFYEANEGEIRINGTPLRKMNKGAYREQLGAVFQENFLFRGTIADNIRLSKPDASLEEVMDAARKAEIHNYIETLPDRYDTEVLDEGANLSGGQRQRIAIARAILRDPPILLLDEATSALDPISEAAINRTFEDLAKGRTVITVTHRLASIAGADCIFVFNQGKLVDSGTHGEMLERGGYYRELWDKQSGLSVSLTGQEAEIDAERMSRLPFFRGVEPHVLAEIKDLFNTENFAAGQQIIQAGDQGEKFYLIARGRVEVSRRDASAEAGKVRLAVLEDGDHFGEIALLENVPRTADVSAITPCVLLTLQRKVLHYVLSKYPEIDHRVRQTLKERLVPKN